MSIFSDKLPTEAEVNEALAKNASEKAELVALYRVVTGKRYVQRERTAKADAPTEQAATLPLHDSAPAEAKPEPEPSPKKKHA